MAAGGCSDVNFQPDLWQQQRMGSPQGLLLASHVARCPFPESCLQLPSTGSGLQRPFLFLGDELLRVPLGCEKSSSPISVVVEIKEPTARENRSERRGCFPTCCPI